jgi:hypothetical protein
MSYADVAEVWPEKFIAEASPNPILTWLDKNL